MKKELEQIIQFFKDSKITKYVLEREISNFMGERTEVEIINETNKMTATSFVIFPIIENKMNGVVIKYLIDYPALFNLYSPAEFVDSLEDLKFKRLLLEKEYFNAFNVEKVFSRLEVLAELLNVYRLTLNSLKILDSENTILPYEDELNEIIVKFREGLGTEADVENLLVKDYIPQEALNFAEEKSIETQSNELSTIVKITDRNTPNMNISYQNIRNYAHPTLGDVRHKDIDYKYIPSTNQ